jgi:NADH-quinone oxidoreductase subunit M
MILVWLVILPAAGGILAWILSRWSDRAARWTSLASLAVGLALVAGVWIHHPDGALAGKPPVAPALSEVSGGGAWIAQADYPWIPALGVRFHLAMDGLSLLMLALTELLGLVAVACSWRGIRERVGFFHLNLMLVLAGITGVFLAMDLFLFYFFWELMLVPMYFLIDIWGHERRHYAAIKFFLFTQLSGLLMLLAILGLYFVHGRATGEYTFDYFRLLGTPMGQGTATWLMLGFFVAFAVKMPAVPLHTWLPDAHTEAPTAGSVILAGLLLKTGAYGMLRFILPLFPEAAHAWAPVFMTLGVIGILYGAVLAFAQTDLKRLVAYTSVSHLGFVLLGLFAGGTLALQGAVMQMVCHGLSTGALFVLVGGLQDRLGTRDMDRLGGLSASVPRMSGVALFFVMASLGLPGLGNFIGEFLVLLGAYQVSVTLAVAATGGLVLATVYALWMMYRVFHGRARETWKPADLDARETVIFAALILALVVLGLYPQPVFDLVAGALAAIQHGVPVLAVAGGAL